MIGGIGERPVRNSQVIKSGCGGGGGGGGGWIRDFPATLPVVSCFFTDSSNFKVFIFFSPPFKK